MENIKEEGKVQRDTQKTEDITKDEQKQEGKAEEDVVTAFNIQAASQKGIDYDKLIQKFGCFKILPEMITKFEELTGQRAHRFLRRNIFFCHRDFEVILSTYEKKLPFFLYTGRGPSAEALHLGHAIPFIFCQYLQQAFDVPIVIQITDDEKFLYRPELELEKVQKMANSNIKDIIAFGFNPEKTFIFLDTEYIQFLYPNTIRVQKCLTLNQVKGIFGFDESDNVGKFAYPPVQAVPAFSNTFPHIFGKRKNVPCLIPCAIDQDPYFRMTRDVASKLKYQKPCSIYSTFFPALQGKQGKMSSSVVTSSILLTDTADVIKQKVNKYAFSGGGATVEEHKAKGADLDVDVPFQYLQFFLEDDEQLEEIRQKYGKGEMMTGDVKKVLIKCLQDFLKEFQERRKKITDADVKKFCEIRKIDAVPERFKEQKVVEEQKTQSQ